MGDRLPCGDLLVGTGANHRGISVHQRADLVALRGGQHELDRDQADEAVAVAHRYVGDALVTVRRQLGTYVTGFDRGGNGARTSRHTYADAVSSTGIATTLAG